MPPEALAAEVEATRKLTSRPFGVNLIVMHPDLDRLVITTGSEGSDAPDAGKLFLCDVGERGLPATPWAGFLPKPGLSVGGAEEPK